MCCSGRCELKESICDQEDECLHGACEEVADFRSRCKCYPGWTGMKCDKDIGKKTMLIYMWVIITCVYQCNTRSFRVTCDDNKRNKNHMCLHIHVIMGGPVYNEMNIEVITMFGSL